MKRDASLEIDASDTFRQGVLAERTRVLGILRAGAVGAIPVETIALLVGYGLELDVSLRILTGFETNVVPLRRVKPIDIFELFA